MSSYESVSFLDRTEAYLDSILNECYPYEPGPIIVDNIDIAGEAEEYLSYTAASYELEIIQLEAACDMLDEREAAFTRGDRA